MPYLSFCDSLKNVALEELDAVCKEHPTLSSRYALFNRNYILSESASDLMQARYRVPDYNLPKEYFDYVTANYLNKIEEPYTAWGNRYITFIRKVLEGLDACQAIQTFPPFCYICSAVRFVLVCHHAER